MFLVILKPMDPFDRTRHIGPFSSEYAARKWCENEWNENTHSCEITVMELPL